MRIALGKKIEFSAARHGNISNKRLYKFQANYFQRVCFALSIILFVGEIFHWIACKFHKNPLRFSHYADFNNDVTFTSSSQFVICLPGCNWTNEPLDVHLTSLERCHSVHLWLQLFSLSWQNDFRIFLQLSKQFQESLIFIQCSTLTRD